MARDDALDRQASLVETAADKPDAGNPPLKAPGRSSMLGLGRRNGSTRLDLIGSGCACDTARRTGGIEPGLQLQPPAHMRSKPSGRPPAASSQSLWPLGVL